MSVPLRPVPEYARRRPSGERVNSSCRLLPSVTSWRWPVFRSSRYSWKFSPPPVSWRRKTVRASPGSHAASATGSFPKESCSRIPRGAPTRWICRTLPKRVRISIDLPSSPGSASTADRHSVYGASQASKSAGTGGTPLIITRGRPGAGFTGRVDTRAGGVPASAAAGSAWDRSNIKVAAGRIMWSPRDQSRGARASAPWCRTVQILAARRCCLLPSPASGRGVGGANPRGIPRKTRVDPSAAKGTSHAHGHATGDV